MPPFFLRTLGGLSLTREGALLASDQRKALALLAVLAASDDTGIGRETLMALLWPESGSDRARGALKQMVHGIRRQLDAPEAIRGTSELSLDRSLVESDVDLFRKALSRSAHEEAVRLYGGPFLAGVHLDAAPEFERWVDGVRAELAGCHRDALERLARAAEARGDDAGAVGWWRELAAADPLNGRVAIALMHALDRTGNGAAAIQHARIHEVLRREELETGPDPAVAALAERLRAAKGAQLTPEADPPPAAAPVPSPATGQAAAGPVDAVHVGLGEATERVPEPRDQAAGGPSHELEKPAPRRRARRAAAVGAIVAAVLAALVVLWVRGRQPSTRVHERRVAVAVFLNRTGDPRLDQVGTMVADWVTRGIARASIAEVFDIGTLYTEGRAASGEPTEPRRLAREHGAAYVVAGNYYRSRDSLYFSGRVMEVESGRVVRALDPVGGSASDPMPAIDEVRQRVTGALASLMDARAGSFTGVEAQPPRFAAYQEFISGQDVYWRGAFGESMAHFRRAMQLDSTFASAALWLGVAAVGVMRCDVVDSVHLALAPRLERLTETERLTRRITAARCETNPAEEHRLQRERAARNPGSSFYQWALGTAARKANRPAETVAVLRAIDPRRELGWLSDRAFYWRELAGAHHALGDFQAEREQAEAFARAGPARLASSYFLARALAGAGRSGEVPSVLARVGRLPPDPVLVAGQMSDARMQAARLATPGWVLYQSAAELLAHGAPEAGQRMAERAVGWLRSRAPHEAAAPEHRWLLAQSLELLGRPGEGMALASALVREDSTSVDYRGTLGVLAARAGDRALAGRVDRWLAARPPRYPVGLPILYRARIAAVLGEHARALTLLEALPHGAHPMGDFLLFHSDPALEPLHRYERFSAFVRPEG